MKSKKWMKLLALCAMIGLLSAMGLVVYAQNYNGRDVNVEDLNEGDILENTTIYFSDPSFVVKNSDDTTIQVSFSTDNVRYECKITEKMIVVIINKRDVGSSRYGYIVKVAPVNVVSNPEESNPEESNSEREDSACEHHYEWTIIRAATMTQDGLEGLRCTHCGDVKETRTGGSGSGSKETSAYYNFGKHVIDEISHAEPGADVLIDAMVWKSCSRTVYEAIAARPDITVTFRFEFEGYIFDTTIPAGADILSLVNEDGYIGFLKLAVEYGAVFVEEAAQH